MDISNNCSQPTKEQRMKMTYTGAGVDYGAMDPFKRMAQQAGRETAPNIARLNGAYTRNSNRVVAKAPT